MTTTYTIDTSAGPITVTATEPAPGLRIAKAPDDVSPLSDRRWILAHHDGPVLAAFTTEDEANKGAAAIAPMTDWTRSAMTTANAISLGGLVEQMTEALMTAGGAHPNA